MLEGLQAREREASVLEGENMRIEDAINDAVDYFMENPSDAFASGLPSQTDVRLVLNDLVGEEGYGRASQSASVKKVMALLKKHSKNLLMENRRRGLRRNQTPMERLRYHVSGAVERGESQAIAGMPMEYARQIPRRDRPMRGRGFDKRFDVSAGSDYNDLYKILTTGRNPGTTKKIGDNTYLFFEKRAPMGYPPILEGPIVVKLYQTPILTYYPNGEVDVNFGGYMTTTTFSRINNLVPYGWNLRKKAGKLALENSWGQRAVIRKPRAGEEYAVRLTSDKAYLID